MGLPDWNGSRFFPTRQEQILFGLPNPPGLRHRITSRVHFITYALRCLGRDRNESRSTRCVKV